MSAPNFNTRLARALRKPIKGRVAHKLLRAQGTQINPAVRFGSDFVLARGGLGTVIDKEAVIGDRVKIYHQVTIGRGHPDAPRQAGEQVIVGDDVIIGAGAKVLCGPGQTLTIGAGARIGANAVVTRSVPAGESWGGIPARRL